MFSANLRYIKANIWGAWNAFITNNPRHYILQGEPKPYTKCFIQKSCLNWSILWNRGTISRENTSADLFHEPGPGVVCDGRVQTGGLVQQHSRQHGIGAPSRGQLCIYFLRDRCSSLGSVLGATFTPPKCLFQQHTGSHLGWNYLIIVGGNSREYG